MHSLFIMYTTYTAVLYIIPQSKLILHIPVENNQTAISENNLRCMNTSSEIRGPLLFRSYRQHLNFPVDTLRQFILVAFSAYIF